MEITVYRLTHQACLERFLTYVGICIFLFSGEIQSQSAKIIANEAHSYALMGDYEAAKVKYKEAINLAPAVSYYYYQKGLCEFELGEDSLANLSFSQAIEILSNRADFYFYRGRSYAELKKYEEALADYSYAIQLDPFMTDYHLHKGRVHYALMQYEEALAVFSQAIEIDTRIGDTYVERALCYIQMERGDLACQDLQQALKKKAFNAKYYWQKYCQ